MAKKAIDRKFKCQGCSGIFITDWTEGEARAEQANNGWENIPNDNMAEVCGNCYESIMAANEN